MNPNFLSKLYLENFTAFSRIDLEFSQGVNIFIGDNGTGKTHILKLLYAACSLRSSNYREDTLFNIIDIFLPFEKKVNRLIHNMQEVDAKIEIKQNNGYRFSAEILNTGGLSGSINEWYSGSSNCVYIPVKEMLAHAPGFRSLYSTREIEFEKIYPDIIDRAYLPKLKLKGKLDPNIEKLLEKIEKIIGGEVVTHGEFFFLKSKNQEIEFSLLAEGMRKFALIWLLIKNGTLSKDAILFWDEPEANLNPKIIGEVVEILLELQRIGIQIFLATHDYVILKEFDLRCKKQDKIRYHALFRDKSSEIKCNSTDNFVTIDPNVITDTFVDLYERDVERDFAVNDEPEKD